MSLKGRLAALFNKSEIHIDENLLLTTIRKHNVKEWFYYAQFKERKDYWNSWEASFFLGKNLPGNAHILETGCGCALNLIWFAQHGFKHLYGIDIEPNFIEAGKELCEKLDVNAKLWVDNCSSPSVMPDAKFDGMIALNWTYHDENFELPAFLAFYSNCMAKGGYICFDVIDVSFNSNPNNTYLTSDWHKPVEERKPTEYKKRYSDSQVKDILKKIGLTFIKRMERNTIVPKTLYIVKK